MDIRTLDPQAYRELSAVAEVTLATAARWYRDPSRLNRATRAKLARAAVLLDLPMPTGTPVAVSHLPTTRA